MARRPKPSLTASAFIDARPKPDYTYRPQPEEFAAWCDHPVTRFVAASHESAAELQKLAWVEMAWSETALDPLERAKCMVRADCYRAFLDGLLVDHLAFVEKKVNGEAS